MKLGVNIDHVATLRNARGEFFPDPIKAALVAEAAGADNITCHLREDRRHITDEDVRRLKENIGIPLNLEMAATTEMVNIAIATKPHEVTIVPEGRQELTTEGGYRVFDAFLKETLTTMHENKIKTVLFIDPEKSAVEQAKNAGAMAVEFHMGDICRELETARDPQEVIHSLLEPVTLAQRLKMAVHIGHGINYRIAPFFQLLPHVSEANIGHAIIAEAVFVGMTEAVRKMKDLLNSAKHIEHLQRN